MYTKFRLYDMYDTVSVEINIQHLVILAKIKGLTVYFMLCIRPPGLPF